MAGCPVTVQNSYATNSERAPSVTDQRHRLALSWIGEPQPFGREHALLGRLFNDWKLSGVVTIGSGRPVDARVFGDPNQDGNASNDRLPGYGRNAFLGPDYATTDLRLTRRLYVKTRIKLELVAEAFNALNRIIGVCKSLTTVSRAQQPTLRRLTRPLESITFLRTIGGLPTCRQSLGRMLPVRFSLRCG